LRARPSITKRAREISKADRKKDKSDKRVQRQQERAAQAAARPEGEDPDIAGIKPGPQPIDPAFLDSD
jgi:hypothetical protein